MGQPVASGLSVSRIQFRYGKKQVLENVSFQAEAGAIVGIAGINGGGKSTLLSILAGVRRPMGGSFVCFGRELIGAAKKVSSGSEERRGFRELVGYLPQDNPLLEELTVRDNLRLWYGGDIPEDLPVLEQMQLKHLLSDRVKSLSGGMKRRLAIACAVSNSQPVLVLDEPSSSLDLHQKKIISDYILDYTGKGGIVIISTHDMEELKLCTQLYYLENGTGVSIGAEEAIERLRSGMG